MKEAYVKMALSDYNEMHDRADHNLPEAEDKIRSMKVQYDNACEMITELASVIIEDRLNTYNADEDLETFMDLGMRGSALSRGNLDYLLGLGIDESLIREICEAWWHDKQ